MTKTYCDICGKTIDFPKFKLELRTNTGCCLSELTPGKIEYDLCKKCHEKIIKYIATEKREYTNA